MRIVTWNVNSVRTRKSRLLRWLGEHRPDALCLQEIKVVDDGFPADELREIGYESAVFGQKTYNGVAILARRMPEDVVRGFEDGVEDDQARLISATVDGVRILNGYFPNGSTMESDKYGYKLRWIERLGGFLEKCHDPGQPLVVCGDFNVAFDDRDMKNVDRWSGGVLYNDEVVGAVRGLLDWGLVDAYRERHEEGGVFTWWDYRGLSFPQNDGLRIDHHLITAPLAERLEDVWMDRDERKKGACPEGTKPSDHVPVVLDLRDGS